MNCQVAAVALLTFVTYFLYHSQRAGFAVVKSVLEDQNGFTVVQLGSIDTGFLFAYALGQFLCGRCADVLRPKRTLVLGMFACAALPICEGIMGARGFHASGGPLWGWSILRVLEGLAQATGWSSTLAIMGNWLPRKTRGVLFGFWSSHANFGDIFGLHWGALVLDHFGKERWHLVLWTLAAFMLAMALVNALLLRAAPPSTPEETGGTSPKVIPAPSGDHVHVGEAAEELEEQRAAGILEVLRVPGLLQYSLGYTCLKLINYALFFWLPFYLTNSVHMDKARSSRTAAMFDWGFMTGGAVAGLLSDLSSRAAGGPMRSPVVSTFLFLAFLPLGSLRGEEDTVVLMALLFCCGVLLGGPSEALNSSISVDFGQHASLRGARATSTCAGVIDGMGAIGAAVGQYVVGRVSHAFGWTAVFNFLLCALAGSLAMSLLRLKAELATLRKARGRSSKFDPVSKDCDMAEGNLSEREEPQADADEA